MKAESGALEVSPPAPPRELLSIAGLHVRYGAIVALRGIDLAVRPREIVAVVGPNGAGKSTLLGAIAGIVRPQAGTIRLEGAPLASRIEDIVRQGVALVPEGRHVFTRLTVGENLKLGATIRRDAEAAREIERYFAIFPILAERRHQLAGQLSGGEQQQLVIARALLSRPKLLLLDEPSLGLAPKVTDDVYALIARIRDEGTTIIVVEQSAPRALAAADRTFVLNGGSFRLSGAGPDLARHPDFEAAYFGFDKGQEEAGA
jgi:branched-chain amino acid transport system ATP-binding protein